MNKKKLVVLFALISCICCFIKSNKVNAMDAKNNKTESNYVETFYDEGIIEKEEILYIRGREPENLKVQKNIIIKILNELLEQKKYIVFKEETNKIISELPEGLINIYNSFINTLGNILVESFNKNTIDDFFRDFGTLLKKELFILI